MTRKYRRTWLNKREGTASVEWLIEQDTFNDNPCIDASFSISDCARKVILEFNFWGNTVKARRKEFNNCVYKIDKLISELEAFKATLAIAATEQE